MASTTVVAYVERDAETGLFVGVVPGIRGAHTQAGTLDELRENLKEVLALCVDEGWLTEANAPKFAGLEHVEVVV
ncbi:MAG: type II toxin-antitoxin system HicB family antitoxin [Dehalococcoidia bacterium]